MYQLQFKSKVLPIKNKNIKVRHTLAIIYFNNAEIARGDSRQNSKDVDDRLIGQKVALTNAITNTKTLNKDQRADIWAQFFNRSNRAKAVISSALLSKRNTEIV